jgi:hypothetical protein
MSKNIQLITVFSLLGIFLYFFFVISQDTPDLVTSPPEGFSTFAPSNTPSNVQFEEEEE